MSVFEDHWICIIQILLIFSSIVPNNPSEYNIFLFRMYNNLSLILELACSESLFLFSWGGNEGLIIGMESPLCTVCVNYHVGLPAVSPDTLINTPPEILFWFSSPSEHWDALEEKRNKNPVSRDS